MRHVFLGAQFLHLIRVGTATAADSPEPRRGWKEGWAYQLCRNSWNAPGPSDGGVMPKKVERTPEGFGCAAKCHQVMRIAGNSFGVMTTNPLFCLCLSSRHCSSVLSLTLWIHSEIAKMASNPVLFAAFSSASSDTRRPNGM